MSMLRRFSRSRASFRAPRQSIEPEPARLAAERQVLGHRHRRDEIDFLIDRADAEGLRLAGRADLRPGGRRGGSRLRRRASAPVRILISVDLPAPFSPMQRVDFAGLDPKIDLLQRPHAGKRLRDSRASQFAQSSFRPRPLADLFTLWPRAQPSRKRARRRRACAPPGPRPVRGALLAMIRRASVGGRRRGVQIGRDHHPLRQFLLVLQVVRSTTG